MEPRATTNVPRKRRPRINRFAGVKWCPNCARFRSRDEFGFDRSRRDGHSGWCRACRADGEKGRRDADLPVSRTATNARYRRDPARFKAHVSVARAVAKGLLSKPTVCPACNRHRKIEAHHYLGYERKNWLNVLWRCRQCHALEHKRGPAASNDAAA